MAKKPADKKPADKKSAAKKPAAKKLSGDKRLRVTPRLPEKSTTE